MMVLNLTKSRMTTILSSLRKIVDYGKGAYLYSDYIVPANEVLARSVIRTVIPFHIETTMRVLSSFSDKSSLLSKEKGLKNIKLILDNDILQLAYLDGTGNANSIIIAVGCVNAIDDFITSVITTYDTFDDVLNNVRDGMVDMSNDDLNKVRLSEVVTLTYDNLTVRMSRDNVPLTGPLRQSGPIPFRIKYKMNQCAIGDGVDSVLTLLIHYKDFDAIHKYSFIPY